MSPETAERLLEIGERAGRCLSSLASEAWSVLRSELIAGGSSGAAPLLTARDVAARLRTNVQTVYRLAREGQLPPVETGRRTLRWTEAVVVEFIGRRGRATEQEQPHRKPLRALQGGR